MRPISVAVLKSTGSNRSALAVAAAAVMLVGAVGDTAKTATAPKLSSTYAMMFTTVCQSDLSISLNGSVLSTNYTSTDVKQYAAAADFTPSKSNPTLGTATLNGWKVAGPPLTVNTSSVPFTTTVQSQAGVSYSLTSNSLTINGTTYNAVHGAITGGVIQQFTYVGVEADSPTCATNGVDIIQ
jgi:hypothetical protein